MTFRLLLAAAATEGLYWLMCRASAWPLAESPGARFHSPRLFEETSVFLALSAAAFLIYALALRGAAGHRGAGVTWAALLGGGLFRMTLLAVPPMHQEPAPDGPLARAADLLSGLLAATGYPLLDDPGYSLRLLAVAADLGALGVLAGALREAGLPSGLALVHAWNPLAIKECAGSGRLETAPLALLLLSFRAAATSHRRTSAALYGASLAASPALLATLPAFLRAGGLAAIVGFLLGGAAWGTFILSGIASDLQLPWGEPESRLGGSLLPAATAVASVLLTREPLYPLLACGAVLALVLVARSLRAGRTPLPGEALVAVGGWLMVAPRVFPWSFVSVSYLAAFSANRGWLVFTATAPLAYLGLSGGTASFWVRVAQYFPAYFALIFLWLGGTARLARSTSRRRKPA